MATDRQQRSSGGEDQTFVEKWGGNFWVNALLGACATFVTGVIPLLKIVAPVAGGAVAGYLQNTGTRDGVKVGAVAGIIGAIGLNLLAPPRFFGLLDDGFVSDFLLITILFGFLVWTITSAFGGVIGTRAAEN